METPRESLSDSACLVPLSRVSATPITDSWGRRATESLQPAVWGCSLSADQGSEAAAAGAVRVRVFRVRSRSLFTRVEAWAGFIREVEIVQAGGGVGGVGAGELISLGETGERRDAER
jgi:hypothetical protein